jgi:hypothetical protein
MVCGAFAKLAELFKNAHEYEHVGKSLIAACKAEQLPESLIEQVTAVLEAGRTRYTAAKEKKEKQYDRRHTYKQLDCYGFAGYSLVSTILAETEYEAEKREQAQQQQQQEAEEEAEEESEEAVEDTTESDCPLENVEAVEQTESAEAQERKRAL